MNYSKTILLRGVLCKNVFFFLDIVLNYDSVGLIDRFIPSLQVIVIN